jgi:hypothetical protein
MIGSQQDLCYLRYRRCNQCSKVKDQPTSAW